QPEGEADRKGEEEAAGDGGDEAEEGAAAGQEGGGEEAAALVPAGPDDLVRGGEDEGLDPEDRLDRVPDPENEDAGGDGQDPAEVLFHAPAFLSSRVTSARRPRKAGSSRSSGRRG